jgi:hypothetical protein
MFQMVLSTIGKFVKGCQRVLATNPLKNLLEGISGLWQLSEKFPIFANGTYLFEVCQQLLIIC